MSKLALVLTCALAVGGPAAAQMAGHGMPGMAADHAGGDGMMASMDKMSKDMAAVPMTGDSDRDFVAMMIPHHQGAIDMAEYELAPREGSGVARLGPGDRGGAEEGDRADEAVAGQAPRALTAYLPPSTLRHWPVIQPAWSLTRNSTASAMSSGVPRRRHGDTLEHARLALLAIGLPLLLRARVGAEEAGSDAVDGDAVRAEFVGELPG